MVLKTLTVLPFVRAEGEAYLAACRAAGTNAYATWMDEFDNVYLTNFQYKDPIGSR